MTVNEFLQQNSSHLRNDIISELETEFNSHDFIKKFAKRFESAYIEKSGEIDPGNPEESDPCNPAKLTHPWIC